MPNHIRLGKTGWSRDHGVEITMKTIKRIYIPLLIAWGILCLSLFVTEQVTGQQVVIQIIKMNLYDFFFVFLCLIGGGAISLLIRFWKKTARKFYKGLLVLGWVGLIGIMILGYLIWSVNHAITTWYEFYSPDNKHSLVVRESTFLLLSDIHPYERTSPLLVRELELEANLTTDDGYPSITKGDYKISWDGDVVTLSIDVNQNAMWCTVKLNMAEHGKLLEKFSSYPNGKPTWLDSQGDTNEKDASVSTSDHSDVEDVQQAQVNQKIIDGLQAVALTTGYKTKEQLEITYTAKGLPKVVLSSDQNLNTYILYDRDSSNGKCALYVLYQLKNNDEGKSDSQILEMYAYEYSSGKVIVADRHAWSDLGTGEYRKATGE